MARKFNNLYGMGNGSAKPAKISHKSMLWFHFAPEISIKKKYPGMIL